MILMIFGIKEKNYNFDPYNELLAIATNIPVKLNMTAFVLLGHIYAVLLKGTVHPKQLSLWIVLWSVTAVSLECVLECNSCLSGVCSGV